MPPGQAARKRWAASAATISHDINCKDRHEFPGKFPGKAAAHRHRWRLGAGTYRGGPLPGSGEGGPLLSGAFIAAPDGTARPSRFIATAVPSGAAAGDRGGAGEGRSARGRSEGLGNLSLAAKADALGDVPPAQRQ